MNLKIGIRSTNKSRKKNARYASPPSMLVEATSMVRINFVVVIFSKTKGHFVRDNTLLYCCFNHNIVSVLP
jgi:hypothetical protein